MIGGVIPAPNPTPAKMMPFAIPRSDDGIHAATTQLVAGYTTASPIPSNRRNAIKIASGRATFGVTSVTAAVNNPHQITPSIKTRRGPSRSASQPPGAWKNA